MDDPSRADQVPPLSSSSERADFLPGTVLDDRYRIVAAIGRGGMGEVYRADDLRLGQPVALKFLPPELEQDEGARERLLTEVRLARTITHPNVCRVYDVGDLPAQSGTPARFFITMEYIDGEDLGTLLRRIGRLPPDKAVAVGRQLSSALAAAHDKGVLHRDLKPANVMIDGRGQVRIADFGIAVAVGEAASAGSAGTAAYMAPETFHGGSASVQSDLYALGLILYEVVTGTSAVTASSPGQWPAAHAVSEPTDPSSVVSDTDPAMERIIKRCLAKEPEDRPSSAAEVLAALPGGDPLAAALAAGETPSPELVAASGDDGVLPRVKAVAWFAAAVAALGVSVWALSSTLLINQTEMPFDTRTLERRANELLVSFGYDTPPTDWRSVWRRDTRRRPHQMRLTYRQSPASLFETIESPASWPSFPEDARVYLDARGRLIGFDVGGDLDYADPLGPQPTDWTPMLDALGADAPPVPASPGRWPPAFYADTRAAWTATIDSVAYDAEAASLRGRPVSLRLKPVDAADERPAPQRGQGALTTAAVSFTLILVLAFFVALARRNLRLGRGDRRGAHRLALFVGLTFAAAYAAVRHWNFEAPNLMAEGIIYLLQMPLLLAASVWVGYVGVEPFFRRRWPSLLVGWTRLLDGRLRDGLVGQSLLAGVLVGTLLVALRAATFAGRQSLSTSPSLYRDLWQLGASPLFSVVGATVAGLALAGLLVLVRLAVGREWATWWALGVFVAVAGLQEVNRFSIGFGDPAAQASLLVVTTAVVTAIVSVGLFRRVGLLALVVAGSVNGILMNAPVTLDASRWYFWRGGWAVALVLAFAVWGFVCVLGRQSLLPDEVLDG
jgi:serine/threonine-protein kinase